MRGVEEPLPQASARGGAGQRAGFLVECGQQVGQRLAPGAAPTAYVEIVVGVDPPAKSGDKADECGIVVAARAEGRQFHDDALRTLRKGPKTWVHTPTSEQRAAWQEFANALAPQIRGQLVPAPIYDEVQQLLREFRASQLAAK